MPPTHQVCQLLHAAMHTLRLHPRCASCLRSNLPVAEGDAAVSRPHNGTMRCADRSASAAAQRRTACDPAVLPRTPIANARRPACLSAPAVRATANAGAGPARRRSAHRVEGRCRAGWCTDRRSGCRCRKSGGADSRSGWPDKEPVDADKRSARRPHRPGDWTPAAASWTGAPDRRTGDPAARTGTPFPGITPPAHGRRLRYAGLPTRPGGQTRRSRGQTTRSVGQTTRSARRTNRRPGRTTGGSARRAVTPDSRSDSPARCSVPSANSSEAWTAVPLRAPTVPRGRTATPADPPARPFSGPVASPTAPRRSVAPSGSARSRAGVQPCERLDDRPMLRRDPTDDQQSPDPAAANAEPGLTHEGRGHLMLRRQRRAEQIAHGELRVGEPQRPLRVSPQPRRAGRVWRRLRSECPWVPVGPRDGATI